MVGLRIPPQEKFYSIGNHILRISNVSSINGMLEQITFVQIDRFLILYEEIFNSYVTGASCAAASTVRELLAGIYVTFQFAK